MEPDNQTKAAELLQELGLKEYEAKCYVALSRMPNGTAKDISEATDVPRTRVYDAIRVLEAKGLVEVQHSSPRNYRGVPVEEATSLLAEDYRSRIDRLADVLDGLPPFDGDRESPPPGEIWSLADYDAITARSVRLAEEAESDVVLVVGDPEAITEDVYEALNAAADRGVEVNVGLVNGLGPEDVRDQLPGANVFASTLPWLPRKPGAGAVVTRILLVDHDTILVGSRSQETDSEHAEQAVVGTGSANGIVVIIRDLLRAALLEGSDREPDQAGPWADDS